MNDKEHLCVHYWVIEPPSGETSRGVCKHCGMERIFHNSVNTKTEKGFFVGTYTETRTEKEFFVPNPGLMKTERGSLYLKCQP